ncbi:MAG: hypothetical protein JXA82_17895 [Sedimentisphaerales bacterium]|nr:hypothetical protein [Sedimentisphaerales bacterium]
MSKLNNQEICDIVVAQSRPRIREYTTREGIGNEDIFYFLRVAKIYAPNEQQLWNWTKAWHERYRDELDQSDYSSFEDVWLAVLEAWPKTKFPDGNFLTVAWNQTCMKKYHFPELDTIASPTLRKVAALCYELSLFFEDRGFYLSSYSLETYLEATQKTVWNCLSLLCQKNILQKTGKGHTGRANEYRYIGKEPDIEYI